MYILEIQDTKRREDTLLRIVNGIYKMKFNKLEESRIVSGLWYIESSDFTKTEKISIKDISGLKKRIHLKSNEVVNLNIINNAHNLTIEAQNALLKDLEEKSDENIIILALTDKRLLLPTIISRGICIKDSEIGIIHPLIGQENFPDLLYNNRSNLKEIEYIKRFLELSLYDQFLYVHNRFNDKKKRLSNKENIDWVESFLLDLLLYYEMLLPNSDGELIENIDTIQNSLEKIRKGVNSRAVIEYIILTINRK